MQINSEPTRRQLMDQVKQQLDEIERLREEIKQSRQTSEFWKANHLAGNAEIERLREALKEIAKQKKTTELVTSYDVECADFEQGYDDCISVARSALQQKESE